MPRVTPSDDDAFIVESDDQDYNVSLGAASGTASPEHVNTNIIDYLLRISLPCP